MSPKIQGIFFDLDDTLIRYTEAERTALGVGCRLAAQLHPAISERALALAIFQVYSQEFCYGTDGYAELATLSVPDFRVRITSSALRTFGIEDQALAGSLVDAYMVAERACLRTFPDVFDTLRILRPHFRLGIITNGPSAMQREKVTSLALGEWFSEIIVDTEFGHPKPDPRIFEFAAGRVGLCPPELLFVGNSLEADVEGARSAGWTSVHLDIASRTRDTASPAPDFTISGIAELLSLPPIASVLAQTNPTEMAAAK